MPQIWAIFFVIFINMLGFGVIVPLGPSFQNTFHLSATQYGILGAAFPLVQMISAPVLGRISDQFGRRPVMIVSSIFVSLSYLILAFSKTFPMLLFSRLVGGFFSGTFVVAMACAADISDSTNRRRFIGIAGMGFGFGFMLGPTMGGLFAGYDPLHAKVFQTAMFALFLSIIGILVIITSLPETLEKGYKATTSVFREIQNIVNRRSELVDFFLSAALSMVIAGLEVFLSLWISRRYSFTPQQIGIFWSVFAVIMNIGRIILLRYLHGYKGVMIGFLALGISAMGYALTSGIYFLYIWTLVIALFSGALITLINSHISLNADPNQQGLFLGLSNSAGNIGRAIAPPIMGYLIQIFQDPRDTSGMMNFHVGWIFLVFICLIALLMAYRADRKNIE